MRSNTFGPRIAGKSQQKVRVVQPELFCSMYVDEFDRLSRTSGQRASLEHFAAPFMPPKFDSWGQAKLRNAE